MPPSIQPASGFSLAQARHIVKDLFKPNPVIYWTDFLLSLIVGGVCWVLVRRAPLPWLVKGVLFFIMAVLFYRAALFTHELTHLRDNSFKAFRFVWNMLCGIPFLMPSFLYHTHVDHHMRRKFGTDDDGEYLPLGAMPRYRIFVYLCQPLVIPLLAVARFMVLAPLSWISPRFRTVVQRRASSLVMDPRYIRPLPSNTTLRIFRIQEVCCFLLLSATALQLFLGRLPIGFAIQAYLTGVTVIYLNHIRTLGAHRYTNAGGEMTFIDQLLDSVNYPNRPLLSEMWAPVGLRFHALHHLFPSLPYHNLAEAHRRLMAQLPVDSPYRQTESPSLTSSLLALWRSARAAEQGNKYPFALDPALLRVDPPATARPATSRKVSQRG